MKHKKAIYRRFVVQNEKDNYRLTVEGYDDDASTADDELSQSNGQEFTTIDGDNDSEDNYNCTETLGGAFWYNTCNPQMPSLLGITAKGDDFKWGRDPLQRAKMYLTCPP